MGEALAAQWILTVFLLVIAIGFGIYGYNQFRNRRHTVQKCRRPGAIPGRLHV